LKFDLAWLQQRDGFLWLEEPFVCPKFKFTEAAASHLHPESNNKSGVDAKISAVGWLSTEVTSEITSDITKSRFGPAAKKYDGVSVLTFITLPGEGFGSWSWWTVKNGDSLIERVHNFESIADKTGGAYAQDRITDELHEIRLVYTAMYLMNQR